MTYYPGSHVPVQGNMTLTARYVDRAAAIAIKFDPNGAQGESVVWYIEKGGNVVLPDCFGAWSYEGYSFIGWSADASEDSSMVALLQPGDGLNVPAAMTVYAKWKRQAYSIDKQVANKDAAQGENGAFKVGQTIDYVITVKDEGGVGYAKDIAVQDTMLSQSKVDSAVADKGSKIEVDGDSVTVKGLKKGEIARSPTPTPSKQPTTTSPIRPSAAISRRLL